MKATLIERLIPRSIRLRRLRSRILDYYSARNPDQVNEEERQVLDYLKHNDLSVFPYAFTEQYPPGSIVIHTDEDKRLFYTLWEGKRLYYKDAKNRSGAQRYFNSLLLEQDQRSPHRYLTDSFFVPEGAVIADVGAAEGNFSLSLVERAGHLYIFEPGTEWVKALQATFEPWASKVTIVQKFVGEFTAGDQVRLDDHFNTLPRLDFLKADVEGAEVSMLKGAVSLISRSPGMQAAVTTYHRQEDAGNIKAFLDQLGFDGEFSDGFMIFHYGRENVVRAPYLRKAVIRATKTH